MSWLQIRFNTTPSVQSSLEDALLGAGALSITYEDAADQPILEPDLNETPLWNDLVVTALFEASIDIKATLATTEALFHQTLPEHKVEILEDKDWVREWMSHYHPMQMGERLWICPSWCEVPNPDAVNLMLDPGLAFGTGTHPTTAMCLQVLDTLSVNNLTVIDYGCGSGILGIAALLLGAESAIGIDIDPQALIASRANTERNGIAAERFPVYLPHQQQFAPADIMMANILAGPLVELADEISALTKNGGFLILSGILLEQAERVMAAYPDFSLALRGEKEWACLYGYKQ